MAKNFINSAAVRELAALLDETGLTEIEYETGTFRVRVGRQVLAGIAPVALAPPAGPPAPGNQGGAADAPADAVHPGTVTSPMVGTVYTSPEPGAESTRVVSIMVLLVPSGCGSEGRPECQTFSSG